MSQHYFNSKRHGRDVCITLGYDRPLDHYFLNIEQDIPESLLRRFCERLPRFIATGIAFVLRGLQAVRLVPADIVVDEDPLLYVSLYDVDAPEDDMDYFREKVRSLGFVVPDSFFLAVEEDAADFIGNYVVQHFADGSIQVLYPKS